ncbi:MAG: glycerophosphodiester phosphodiesterase family protein [Pseudomonadota bacterium]
MTPNVVDPGRLMAHRGASLARPENTLGAIREADRQGAYWIEFDVSLLGDGTAVVHHDGTLDRCTNRTGSLSEIGIDDLPGIEAGPGEPLPTLDQVLDLLDELGMFANLEMKSHDVPSARIAGVVADALRARPWTDGRIITSSFDLKALTVLRQILPAAAIAVLYYNPPSDWPHSVTDLSAAALHLHYTHLNQALLRQAESLEVDVRIFTANEPQLLVPFRDLPLTGIITDHPPLFLKDPDWGAWVKR